MGSRSDPAVAKRTCSSPTRSLGVARLLRLRRARCSKKSPHALALPPFCARMVPKRGAQPWPLRVCPSPQRRTTRRSTCGQLPISVKRRPAAAPDVLAAMAAAVRKRPSSTDCQLCVQGGDNLQEANFGGVKQQLRRRSSMRNTRHAGAHFLASAWLLHSPGLEGVGKAVRLFLSDVVDRQDPRTYWQCARQSVKDGAPPVAPRKVRKRPAASASG